MKKKCRTLISTRWENKCNKYLDLDESTTFESLAHLGKGISDSQITNAQDKIPNTTIPYNLEHNINNIHDNVLYDMAPFTEHRNFLHNEGDKVEHKDSCDITLCYIPSVLKHNTS